MNPLKRLLAIIKQHPEGESDLKAQIIEQAVDMLSNGVNFHKLNTLLKLCDDFMETVPIEAYQLYCPLVESKNHLILDSLSRNQELPRAMYLQYIIIVINNYNNVSQSLAVLGLVGEAWNYQILAIDPFHQQGQIYMDWPEGLWIEACDLQIPQAREAIISIMANFFYISRILGHNREQCIRYYLDTRRWLDWGEGATENDIYYLCFLIDHLKPEPELPLTREVYEQLKNQYDVEMSIGRKENAALIAEALSSMASLMGESDVYWAKEGLKIAEGNLHIQTKMKFDLKIYCESSPINVEGIKVSLTEFLQFVSDNVGEDQLVKDLQKQRLSDLFVSCIVKLIQQGLHKDAMETWLLWKFHSNEIHLLQNKLSYLGAIQNLYEDKMIYLLYDGTHVSYYEFSREIDLVEIMKAKSKYENSWQIVAGQTDTSEAFIGDGVPDPRESNNYEKKLEQFYAPQKIAEVLNQLTDQREIILMELSWMNSPLIPLIQQYTNITLKYSNHAHLKQPSEIKKVLIWCDPDNENSLYDAHIEKDAIIAILNKLKVAYDVFVGPECTFQEFMKCYTQMDYDLIWLMCHGNYNSDNPLQSSLTISNETSATLKYLFDHPYMGQKRRLLVLNACESGASAIRYDSMAFVGLGASLSTYNQSVIGHLWSVDSFAAAVFGCLLMESLTRGVAWDKSVHNVRNILKSGREEITKTLSGVLDSDSQLMRSIINRTSMEWSLLVYWASANFYE